MQVLTVGSAMVDVITIVMSADIERMTMHNATTSFLLLEQGRKIEAESISSHIGGGAINAAVSLSRAGHEVACLCKLGRDRYGDRVLRHLEAENVSSDFVLYAPEIGTGTSVMVASHDRNATIFTHRGANTEMRAAELTEKPFAGRNLVYVTNLSNESADCFPQIVAMAKAAGAFVATNPGIRQLASRAGPFFTSLQDVDLLSINAVEAARLLPGLYERTQGERRPKPVEGEGGDLPPLLAKGLSYESLSLGLPATLAALLSLGPRFAVITDGGGGAYLGWREGVAFVEAVPCESAGTAGAGDGFSSTLAGMIAAGRPVAAAMQAAAVNAAAVLAHVDAQTGLLGREALEQQTAIIGPHLPVRQWGWTEFDLTPPG